MIPYRMYLTSPRKSPTRKSSSRGHSLTNKSGKLPSFAVGLPFSRVDPILVSEVQMGTPWMTFLSRCVQRIAIFGTRILCCTQNSASQLDKLINRWATEVVRVPPVPLQDLCRAILSDVVGGGAEASHQATSMQVQNYLRHAISEAISEGIINCLIVTNSQEANVQLTRIHEHLFARTFLRCP